MAKESPIQTPRDGFAGRRSVSAEASLKAEIERTRRMTVEERILAALSMRKRFSWVKPVREGE
jgi:hypothetical protein